VLSKRVTLSHTPNVSALGSHDVHPVQVSELARITPAKPPPHWQEADRAGLVLELGQGQHWLGRSEAVNVPLAQAVQLDARGMPEPVWKVPASQAWHADSRPAPDEGWNLPGPHAVQLAELGMPWPVW
jgi:hypothetical protein